MELGLRIDVTLYGIRIYEREARANFDLKSYRIRTYVESVQQMPCQTIGKKNYFNCGKWLDVADDITILVV